MNEIRISRARFRAWRRGFREADLILGPFADEFAAGMSESKMSQFERLLEQPDHDLYRWILGQAPTPPEFEDGLMADLRDFARAPHKPFVHGG